MNDSNYFKIKSWRQGILISEKSTIQTLLDNSCGYMLDVSQVPEILMIISQSCDILHDKVEDEPYIEFLAGYIFKKEDRNLFNGKNPRRLQVIHDKKILSFAIHDILRVPKDVFERVDPKPASIIMERDKINLIANWVAKRYVRAAFPDEFNRRIKEAKKAEKASKNPLMGNVSLIFIDVSDEELDIDHDYFVKMMVGVAHKTDPKIFPEIEDLLFDAFNVQGITIEIEVHDDYDITYKTINTYRRYDWDYRSLPDDSDVASPASGIDTV